MKYIYKDSSFHSYRELLKDVQKFINTKYSEQVSNHLEKSDNKSLLTDYIKRYLLSENIRLNGELSKKETEEILDELAESLYQDMAGSSILAPYLNDPKTEEININGWNQITVNTAGDERIIDGIFLSPENAVDVIKRLVSVDRKLLDDTTPCVKASLSNNIRIIAMIYPSVPKEVGVYASIRIVHPNKITKEELIAGGTATEEMLDMLAFFINHGVSIAFAGRTGSGKTVLEGWTLGNVPYNKRIFTIEDGCRQLDLIVKNKKGRPANVVISYLTCPECGNDQEKGLEYALKFDPDVIAVEEMVSGEAFAAQEAARTGHVVVATTHSSSAPGTYLRMTTLSQLKSALPDDTLMRMMVEAFPIIVYMGRPGDGSRRVMEIIEGESYSRETGLVYRELYRFETKNTIKDEKTIVNGKHIKVTEMSEKLKKVMYDHGATEEQVKSLSKGGAEKC